MPRNTGWKLRESSKYLWNSCLKLVIPTLAAALVAGADLPANRWTEVAKDMAGARRGSAIRYAPASGGFFLWGYMNDDPDLPQEQPLMRIPEYDVVMFDLAQNRWVSHLPREMEKDWAKQLPLAYVPRTYSGITTGSERTVMRGASDDEGAVPRPDLNIVFDQVTYYPPGKSLIYFTGGLTASYDVARRRWTDLRPHHSPPPLLGGSLAYDPLHEEIVLFGGGHVAERGADGAIHGYTGTWVYNPKQNDWRQLSLNVLPPPRMNTRLVTDTRNNVLVLFGGDSQTHYLADAWLFDLKSRTWRKSNASAVPEARAGHFTVYDPDSGLVISGGGYNRKDLTDLWAYDAAKDRWTRLPGEVPAGFYISGDIAPEKRLILLTTNTRKPGDRMNCNVLFPVRTTYAYRLDLAAAGSNTERGAAPSPIAKQVAGPDNATPERARAQAERLKNVPINEFVLLPDPGRAAPTRTWGSATFDTAKGQILYWGGGHCGYEGNDVDAYDVAANTWRTGQGEYPERLWNHAVNLAGLTFAGGPWTDHGRRIFAYDPVGRRMIMARNIRLTSGYNPDALSGYKPWAAVAPDALVSNPSGYSRSATFAYDVEKRAWKLIGPAPAGMDTLVTTPHGVMGVTVNWRARLNDAGYQRPWRPADPPLDNSIYLLRDTKWERMNKPGPSPQNLYEMTSLAYDSKRDRVFLHGAGLHRDELWVFDFETKSWKKLDPKVEGGGQPPACAREAVYIPGQDAFITIASPHDQRKPALWVYKPADNTWRQMPVRGISETQARSQNRAMLFDPARDLVLMVLGDGGDEGRASVYAMRFRM